MQPRAVVLLAMLAALVAALFALSVSVAPRHDAIDPRDAGGLEQLDRILANVPGLGRPLRPDDVEATPPECFDGRRFRADPGIGPCRFEIPRGIDRAALVAVADGCVIRVTGQPDVPDQELGPGDAASDGELRVAVGGRGASVELRATGAASRCSAALAG